MRVFQQEGGFPTHKNVQVMFIFNLTEMPEL